jgi:hypothetical protein
VFFFSLSSSSQKKKKEKKWSKRADSEFGRLCISVTCVFFSLEGFWSACNLAGFVTCDFVSE